MNIAHFKPVFGNQRHLEIGEMVAELRKKEEKLQKFIDEDFKLGLMRKEIKTLETQINRVIEEENKLALPLK